MVFVSRHASHSTGSISHDKISQPCLLAEYVLVNHPTPAWALVRHCPISSQPFWDRHAHVVVVQGIPLEPRQCMHWDGASLRVFSRPDYSHPSTWEFWVQMGPHSVLGAPSPRGAVESYLLGGHFCRGCHPGHVRLDVCEANLRPCRSGYPMHGHPLFVQQEATAISASAPSPGWGGSTSAESSMAEKSSVGLSQL